MKARRSYVRIIYKGRDITGEITPYLKRASYTDNLDKGDSASFTLLGDKIIKRLSLMTITLSLTLFMRKS